MSSIQRGFKRQYRASSARGGKRSGPGFYGPRTRVQWLFNAPVTGRSGGVTRTLRPRARRPDYSQVTDLVHFDPSDCVLMPKPVQVSGRPDTYLGPHLVPLPRQGERIATGRRYWKTDFKLRYEEGAAILYRLGASAVWRNDGNHALEASFPRPASVSVLDSAMQNAGWLPTFSSFSN